MDANQDARLFSHLKTLSKRLKELENKSGKIVSEVRALRQLVEHLNKNYKPPVIYLASSLEEEEGWL